MEVWKTYFCFERIDLPSKNHSQQAMFQNTWHQLRDFAYMHTSLITVRKPSPCGNSRYYHQPTRHHQQYTTCVVLQIPWVICYRAVHWNLLASYIKTSWWCQRFLFSTLPGGDDPIWPMFFRWVGSTTNQISCVNIQQKRWLRNHLKGMDISGDFPSNKCLEFQVSGYFGRVSQPWKGF